MPMSEKSLKGKAIAGFIWNILDKVGQQGLAFVVGIILARLLSVEDYGLVGLLAVFTALANILQESGFSSALIQAKEVEQKDYSSVFYFNVIISFIIYSFYFFISPWIADFYDKPILIDLSRLVFLAFVFNACGIVQNVQLMKSMHFKRLTQINLLSGIFSLVVSLGLALGGWGVWALASQLVALSFMKTLLLWSFSSWRPTSCFDLRSLRKFSKFSINLLCATLSAAIVGNILPIILGKFYSISKVGFYNQANRYYNFTLEMTSAPINTVSFPMLSEAEHIGRDLKPIFRKTIRFAAFMNFPVMFGIMAISRSFVLGFLGEKWEPSIGLLILFCVYGLFAPFPMLFMNLLKTWKQSNVYLYLELLREVLILISLGICFRWDIFYLLLGITIANILFYICCVWKIGRMLSYSIREHLMDILPYLVIALCMSSLVSVSYLLTINYVLLFFVQMAIGGIFYFGMNYLLHSKIQQNIFEIIMSSLKKRLV